MEMKVCHCNNARVTGGSQEELIMVEPLELEYTSQEETKEEDKEYNTPDLARGQRSLLDRIVSPSPELWVIDEVTPECECSAGVLVTELGSDEDAKGNLASDMHVSLVCSVLVQELTMLVAQRI